MTGRCKNVRCTYRPGPDGSPGPGDWMLTPAGTAYLVLISRRIGTRDGSEKLDLRMVRFPVGHHPPRGAVVHLLVWDTRAPKRPRVSP